MSEEQEVNAQTEETPVVLTEPTPEMIQEWKVKHGRVQRIMISDVTYYYRPVTVDEYLSIQNSVMSDGNISGEEITTRVGLLFPEELDEKPKAGVVLKVSDEILKMSGFDIQGSPEEL